MKRPLLLTIYFVASCFDLCHAITTDSISRLGLPVLNITTINNEEPTCDYVFAPEGAFGISTTNNTKVPGRCIFTLLGDTIFDSGEYKKDQSGMTLKIRGNTSAYYSPKKPFKLKLEKKNDLFGRGDSCYYDKNWVLLPEGDALNTLFGNKVNELVGMPWTPAARYVNLIVNDDYRGIYLLTEQVKRNADCRLNVDKKTGYVIERDAYWWNEDPYFKTDLLGIEYTFKYPDEDDVTTDQISYIKKWIEAFEKELQQDGPYEHYVDLSSWASWLLAHEILGTYDSGGSNLYLTKNDSTSGSLLQMSTLWDFGSIMQRPTNWVRIHVENFFYFNRLLNSKNHAFRDAFIDRWNELSPTIFQQLNDYFSDFSQSPTARAIDRSRPHEYDRWNNYDDALTQQNISSITNWLSEREQWMKEAIEGLKTITVEQLTVVQTKRPQKAYNLLGQPVDIKSYSGVYIMNGKKFYKK